MYKSPEINDYEQYPACEDQNPSSPPLNDICHRDHDLPAIAYMLLAGIFSALMLVAFAIFWSDAHALFMVVISTGYLAMYIGIPYLLYGMSPDLADGRMENLRMALKRKVHTFTGHISGFEAIAQVITVPTALLVTFVTMGIILVTGPW